MQKAMGVQTKDALLVRIRHGERTKNKSSGGGSKSRGIPKSPGPSVRKCWKCGKVGHYKKDCKSKNIEKNKGYDDVPSIDGKTSMEEGGDVYLASTSTHAYHDAWLIDTGAYFRMTPHKEWFCEYEKFNGGDIFLGDNSVAKIIRHGKVKLLLNDGRIITLLGVLHILYLAGNLIFVSNMGDAGVQTIFEKETCKMVRGALVLMRVVRVGTLYKLLGSTYINECNSTTILMNETSGTLARPIEQKNLWHQRMGHIGEKGLRALQSKGMAEGIPNCSLNFDLCEHFIYGKPNRVRFASGATRSKGILELIHSDVFRLVLVPYLGGSVYYVSFIDDFSRNTWLYFLKK